MCKFREANDGKSVQSIIYKVLVAALSPAYSHLHQASSRPTNVSTTVVLATWTQAGPDRTLTDRDAGTSARKKGITSPTGNQP